MIIKSPEEFHNKLGFIFHALLALPLAVFVYLFLEIRHRNLQPALNNDSYMSLLTIVLPIIATVAVGVGYYLYRQDQKVVNAQQRLQDKLSVYYEISVKFYAFIAVAAVLVVIGLYLTISPIFTVAYVLLLFLMSLNRPSIRKYVRDIKLTKEEKDIILHKKSFEGTDPQEKN